MNRRQESTAAFGLEVLEPRRLMAIDAADVPSPLHVAPERETISEVITPDISGDGRPDVVMISGRRVIVRVNRGDGTFRPERAFELGDGLPGVVGRNRPTALLAGDFNGDGRTDVAVGGYTIAPGGVEHGRTWLLVGRSRGRLMAFGRPSYEDHLSGDDAAIDIDRDGADDIVSHRMTFSRFGDGQFEFKGEVAARYWFVEESERPVFADVDADGDTDIVAWVWPGEHVLIRNTRYGANIEVIADRSPEFQAQLLDLAPTLPTRFGEVATADFDGDGREDSVLARNYNRSPGFFGWVWSAIYVELAAEARPAARASGLSGDGPGYGVERDGIVTVNTRFWPSADTGAAIDEVNVFLDTNGNRRLDGGDLRIGASTTPDTERPNLYRLQIRRRPAWNAAGTGPVAVFTVAMDELGRVSTPQSGRVWLI
jgi:hypothetical protein